MRDHRYDGAASAPAQPAERQAHHEKIRDDEPVYAAVVIPVIVVDQDEHGRRHEQGAAVSQPRLDAEPKKSAEETFLYEGCEHHRRPCLKWSNSGRWSG